MSQVQKQLLENPFHHLDVTAKEVSAALPLPTVAMNLSEAMLHPFSKK